MDAFERGVRDARRVGEAGRYAHGFVSVPARAVGRGARAVGEGLANLVVNVICYLGVAALVVGSLWALITEQPWTKRVQEWGGCVVLAFFVVLGLAFLRARWIEHTAGEAEVLIWGSMQGPYWSRNGGPIQVGDDMEGDVDESHLAFYTPMEEPEPTSRTDAYY